MRTLYRSEWLHQKLHHDFERWSEGEEIRDLRTTRRVATRKVARFQHVGSNRVSFPKRHSPARRKIQDECLRDVRVRASILWVLMGAFCDCKKEEALSIRIVQSLLWPFFPLHASYFLTRKTPSSSKNPVFMPVPSPPPMTAPICHRPSAPAETFPPLPHFLTFSSPLIKPARIRSTITIHSPRSRSK